MLACSPAFAAAKTRYDTLFFSFFLGQGIVPPKSWLASCSVFRQTGSMEAEIDCKPQSNYSSGALANDARV